jgi:hypothetical protein
MTGMLWSRAAAASRLISIRPRMARTPGKDKAAQALGRKGGKARASKLAPEQRTEIA